MAQRSTRYIVLEYGVLLGTTVNYWFYYYYCKGEDHYHPTAYDHQIRNHGRGGVH